VKQCQHSGEVIHHHRADDLPAYLVVVIVAHVVVGGFMSLEAATAALSLGLQLAIWIPLSIALAAGLLRPVKGAVVGLQWALYMHGFGGEPDHIETHPEA
jgi:uncharacterized protein (DUF983 family)